ncbi:hypothetical protein [Nonomuraea typhae]|uniref:hypothetical protein n=1 Tax=Nonomuraea typhae TaxID=2603600 RepID=UPI0012FBF570|nr:hypothetical protein [Nonomuraea typhae]
MTPPRPATQLAAEHPVLMTEHQQLSGVGNVPKPETMNKAISVPGSWRGGVLIAVAVALSFGAPFPEEVTSVQYGECVTP